jgi:hypothetical protein
MNRFDNGSISAYTPQSMQELAFVPLMKRAKHDEMSKNLAELSAIATDPLNEHHDEALRLKQDLEGKLGNLSGELASRGIDSIGKDSFYKLQKERNDLIAPTGRIGQINAAKIAEAKAKEDFMKNSDKQFGQNVLEQKWLEHRAKYKGYDDKNNIVNIGNLGSPKYVDLDTGIRDVLSTLGSTTTEKLLNSGLQFKNTDHGVVMTNAQGSIVTETNYEQLNNALKALKTRFIDKTGEGRISRDFEGRTTNEDLDYINNRVLGAKVFKQNKDYKTTYDMLNPPSGSGDGNGGDGSLLTDVMTEPGDKDRSYGQAITEVNRLSNLKKKNGSLTSAEQMDLEKYTAQTKAGTIAIKNAEKNDKDYINTKKIAEEGKNKLLNSIPENFKNVANLYINTALSSSSRIAAMSKMSDIFEKNKVPTVVRKKLMDNYDDLIKSNKPYYNKRQDIFSKSNDYYTSYTTVPVSPDSKKEYDALNETLHNVLKNSSSANGNGIIYSVKDENGKFKPLGNGKKDKENEDYDGIVGLLGNAKGVKITDFSDIHDTGIPTMTIEADMGDSESTYDLAGLGSGSKNIGGKGNKVTFKVNMNNLRTSHDGSATIDPGNFSNKFIKYLYNQGGKSKVLAESMLANITKHQNDKNN